VVRRRREFEIGIGMEERVNGRAIKKCPTIIFGGGAQNEVLGDEGGLGRQCFHGMLRMPKRGLVFGTFSNHR
jgi:hypothetical protein